MDLKIDAYLILILVLTTIRTVLLSGCYLQTTIVLLLIIKPICGNPVNTTQSDDSKPVVSNYVVVHHNFNAKLDTYKSVEFYLSPINRCYETEDRIWDYQLNGGNNTWYTESISTPCPSGKYSDGLGSCSLTELDCFHDRECYVPKDYLLGTGNCKETDWASNLPNYCSIISPGPGCDPVGSVVKLPWVVDRDGSKRIIRKLNIEISQTGKPGDSYYEDKRYHTSGEITGTELYCKTNNLNLNRCVRQRSNGLNPFRIMRRSAIQPTLHLGSCSTPVYCFGLADILVFDHMLNGTRLTCGGCHASCSREAIELVIPEKGQKLIQICGRHSCTSSLTTDTMISIKRTFHQKISDERVTLEISDIGKTYIYSMIASCPLQEICEAITCTFCREFLLNPTCYNWVHWIVALACLYMVLIGVGMSLIIFKPLLIILLFIINVVYLIVKKVIYQLTRIVSGLCQSIVKFAKHEDGQSDKAGRSQEIYRPLVERETTIRKPAGKVAKNPRSLLHLINIIAIMMMKVIGTCAESPCSLVEVESLKAEFCSKENNRYNCKSGTVINVPMVSYDQTSCLHFLSPKGVTVAMLQITPLDLNFRCFKKSEYWTRDITMSSDHLVHCPHSGDCSDEWCHKVNNSTKIEGLAELAWPYHQFCKLGPACWNSGCFYCTSSCHTVRYYAKPRSGQVYEVYSCPKWEPSGTFHFLWKSQTDVIETTLSLVHGETKTLSRDIKITLQMTVQAKLPLLSQDFITNGDKVALIKTSPAGQPLSGMVGQIQCSDARTATEMRSCSLAPNICICNPNEATDDCDCAQVDLSEVFSGQTALPLTIGNDYLTTSRGVPILKTAAYGSAIVKVKSPGSIIGDQSEQEDCKFNFKSLMGCHSCILGSNITYSCESLHSMSAVFQCDGGINFIVECTNDASTRTARAQFNSPLIDVSCSSQCSKALVRIHGSLKSVGLQVINSGSQIQLSPVTSLSSTSDWLLGAWNVLGWWNTMWLGAIISFTILITWIGITKVSSIIHKDKVS
ncbi:glycoprotein precursor [Ceraphron bunya-like virus]|uniref:Envelopment polyprotein n=1 Tax=Ceraphron bunya-like virus TaxID=2984168 RepID=A0A9N6YJB6_9VIRU|nr:glycoprotein precursor [Ceraphron bunya-like virus]DAZ90966.1 TPA_asm: glycoprotein precursor [Ceraphron bunya-like virus]